jgi:type I restriction enzyme S subunit
MALTVSVPELVANSTNPLLAAKPHWQRIRLGDVATVLNGAPFKSELFGREGGVPLIRIRDVLTSSSDTRYLGGYEARYAVVAGDLLVGMDGDFNCARWRGAPGVLNQRVCKITVDPSAYEPRFLDCVLPGYLRAINEATSSVTVKHLSSRSLEDIPLPLPPFSEQRALADEIEKQFSRLDEAVANLQRVRASLKRYRAAVLRAAFEGSLVVTDAERAMRLGSKATRGETLEAWIHRSRRENWLGRGKLEDAAAPGDDTKVELPEGWALVSWEAVLAAEDGAFKRGPFGSALTKAMFVDSGYKVYEQYCPINDDCSFARYYITPEKFEQMRAFEVRAGDFLISCSGVTLGRITRVPAQFEQGVINQALLRVRLNTEVLDPTYFLHLFRSPQFQRYLFDRSAGAAIPNLRGVDELKAIPIAVPPMAEQLRVVAEVDRRLSIIGEVEAEVDANLKRAQALRQAVLSKVFQSP